MPPLTFLRRLLTGKGPSPSKGFAHPAEELINPELKPYLENHNWRNLRYPPYQEGYPGQIAGTWFMRKYQAELIDRIAGSIGLPDDEYARYVEPILSNFAELAHLLPASQNHHHDGPGGLLRHSLEVAAYTLDGCLTSAFDASETPARRSMRLRRWYVAGVAAGLLHDAGKPLSDIRATSFDGAEEWNYERETLHTWSVRTGLPRYFLHWNPDRHANHVQVSVSLVRGIIPDEARAWIRDGGHDIYEAMLDAISGTGKSPLTALVAWADETSVKHDIRKGPRNGSGGDTGVPVPRLVTDAMLRLIDDGSWKVNTPGGRVWVATDGVYIAWSQAAGEIVKMVVGDGVVALPRSPETLIGTLASHGIAERAANGELYWYVTPHLLRKNGQAPALRCLKLTSPDLLFPLSPVPPPISISLGKEGKLKDLIAPNDKQGAVASAVDATQADLFGPDPEVAAEMAPNGESAAPKKPVEAKSKRKKSTGDSAKQPGPSANIKVPAGLASAAGEVVEVLPESQVIVSTEPEGELPEPEEAPPPSLSLEEMLGELSQAPADHEAAVQGSTSTSADSASAEALEEDSGHQLAAQPAQEHQPVHQGQEAQRPAKISLSQLKGVKAKEPAPAAGSPAPKAAQQQPTKPVPGATEAEAEAEGETDAALLPLDLAGRISAHEAYLLRQQPALASKLVAAAQDPSLLRVAYNKVFVRLGGPFINQDLNDLLAAGWLWQNITVEGAGMVTKLQNREGFLLNADYSLIVCKLADLNWHVPHVTRLPEDELPLLRRCVEQVMAKSAPEQLGGLHLRSISPNQVSLIAAQNGVRPDLVEEAIYALRDAVKVAVRKKILIRALPEEIPSK